MNYEFFDN